MRRREPSDGSAPPPAEAGFTLIEVIVALALFALIGLAGFALVDSVLGVRARTEGRLDRLADLQRAIFVIDADLTQIAAGPLEQDGQDLLFQRSVRRPGLAAQPVRYALRAGILQRVIGGTPQTLLSGVTAVRWRFLVRDQGWRNSWPPSRALADAWPAAVAIELDVAPNSGGASGTLRRVVALPGQP